MKNALQVFQFDGHEVRTCGTDRDPWFVAKDVVEALGGIWNGEVPDYIPKEWRATRQIPVERRNPDGTATLRRQGVAVINEAAVYKLAFRSRKPSAESFTDWVASDVLPSIRRTGAYDARRTAQYERQGKDQLWIEERKEGIKERNHLTETLKAHEATNYAECTNAIYQPTLGASAAMMKAKLQLPQKANLRDSLSRSDLLRVKLAEAMATQKIEQEDVCGNTPCRQTCRAAGNAAANAIDTFLNTPIR